MRYFLPLLLFVVCGCTSRGMSERSAPTDCSGQVVAIVTNNLSEGIDIRAAVSGQSSPLLLGTVSGGERREFILPVGVAYVYPYISSRGTSSAQRDRIHTRYECRS